MVLPGRARSARPQATGTAACGGPRPNGAARTPSGALAFPAVGILSKIENWRMKFFLWIGLPVIAAMGMMFGAFDLVPAWQAHNGGGTAGTFTAEREECGRRSCSFHGSWAATDGSDRRDDVILYDEPDALRTGATVEAVDSGARKGVFATAGGKTYLLVSAFVIGGLAALVGWIFVIRNAIRDRRRPAFAG